MSKNQHCENLQNYFLQSDWDEMAKNPGVLKKCMTLSNRLALLGLLNPDEQTSVAAVAIAYVADPQRPHGRASDQPNEGSLHRP